MDMYYALKDILTCKECDHPFTLEDEIAPYKEYSDNKGHGVYYAMCIGCGKEIQVEFKVRG